MIPPKHTVLNFTYGFDKVKTMYNSVAQQAEEQ